MTGAPHGAAGTSQRSITLLAGFEGLVRSEGKERKRVRGKKKGMKRERKGGKKLM